MVVAPGTQEAEQPEAAGTTRTEQEAAPVDVSSVEQDTGTTPAEQEAATVDDAAVEQKATGTPPSEREAAAVHDPAVEQGATGTPPSEQEAATVDDPAVEQEATGTPPSEREATAVDDPAVEQGAARTPPSEREATTVDVSSVQPEDAGTSTSEQEATTVDVSSVRQEATGTTPDADDEVAGVTETEEETVGAAAYAGEVGQRPTFRNRAGRRVAGRCKAQPSSRGGQGGSKYLKRCPARDTRVERKRGGGCGQEARGITWSGVVRGGAHPGDKKVCMIGRTFYMFCYLTWFNILTTYLLPSLSM